MGESEGEDGDSHSTTVKYTDATREFLEKYYPDALSDADAIRHAISDARKFNQVVEDADFDGDDD